MLLIIMRLMNINKGWEKMDQIYNKLVRDNIPDIIKENHPLSIFLFRHMLLQKGILKGVSHAIFNYAGQRTRGPGPGSRI